MSKKDFENEFEREDNLTDNSTEDVSKEPIAEEIQDEDKDSSDNTAEELAKMKDAYLRLMAEYDNYSKRTLKEKAELIKSGGEKVLLGLLPIADDFERALDNIHNAKDIDAVKEGVDLIYNKFMNFLQQNGVKPIESIGKPFDDELFEAVAVVPAQNEDQKGIVVDNVQKGYTLNGKVIRHAKVVAAN